MKRVLLVFASLLIGLTTASATELNHTKSKIKLDKKTNYRYAQPIMFIERDVEFIIFPDGSFDFNTNINNGYYDDVYYRSNSRRSNVNVSYRGPNSRIKYSSSRYPNRGVSISRDRDGTVRRIGNVYLNYDRYGRITRAGSIFMRYERGRHSQLSRVGGLQVEYNRWGEIKYTRGQVNRFYNDYCNFCGVNSCGVTHDFRKNRGNGHGHGHGNHNNHDDDWFDNNDDWYDNDDGVYDDSYFYYKQNGKVKKHKKNKKYKR